MKRLLAFAAGVLMLVSCSETFDAGRLLQGGMIAAQAMSLSDEQVQAYVHQYVTQLDAQSKVLPETNAYTKRLRSLTKGLTSVDGIPLNFKVYQENQVNAFACADGSVRVYTGIMDVISGWAMLRRPVSRLMESMSSPWSATIRAAASICAAERLRPMTVRM